MPGTVPSPRHRRNHHPMLRAAHPRRVGLEHRANGAQIQAAPPPASLTGVIPRTTPPAQATPATLPAPRPHVDNEQLLVLIELDTLHMRLLDAQQPRPYPAIAHAVPHP